LLPETLHSESTLAAVDRAVVQAGAVTVAARAAPAVIAGVASAAAMAATNTILALFMSTPGVRENDVMTSSPPTGPPGPTITLR